MDCILTDDQDEDDMDAAMEDVDSEFLAQLRLKVLAKPPEEPAVTPSPEPTHHKFDNVQKRSLHTKH